MLRTFGAQMRRNSLLEEILLLHRVAAISAIDRQIVQRRGVSRISIAIRLAEDRQGLAIERLGFGIVAHRGVKRRFGPQYLRVFRVLVAVDPFRQGQQSAPHVL